MKNTQIVLIGENTIYNLLGVLNTLSKQKFG